MLCDICIHRDVCKYSDIYAKVESELAKKFKESIGSAEGQPIFNLLDISCIYYYSLELRGMPDTLNAHSDNPGERGFNGSIFVQPSPNYPLVYRRCPCDDPLIP